MRKKRGEKITKMSRTASIFGGSRKDKNNMLKRSLRRADSVRPDPLNMNRAESALRKTLQSEGKRNSNLSINSPAFIKSTANVTLSQSGVSAKGSDSGSQRSNTSSLHKGGLMFGKKRKGAPPQDMGKHSMTSAQYD